MVFLQGTLYHNLTHVVVKYSGSPVCFADFARCTRNAGTQRDGTRDGTRFRRDGEQVV